MIHSIVNHPTKSDDEIKAEAENRKRKSTNGRNNRSQTKTYAAAASAPNSNNTLPSTASPANPRQPNPTVAPAAPTNVITTEWMEKFLTTKLGDIIDAKIDNKVSVTFNDFSNRIYMLLEPEMAKIAIEVNNVNKTQLDMHMRLERLEQARGLGPSALFYPPGAVPGPQYGHPQYALPYYGPEQTQMQRPVQLFPSHPPHTHHAFPHSPYPPVTVVVPHNPTSKLPSQQLGPNHNDSATQGSNDTPIITHVTVPYIHMHKITQPPVPINTAIDPADLTDESAMDTTDAITPAVESDGAGFLPVTTRKKKSTSPSQSPLPPAPASQSMSAPTNRFQPLESPDDDDDQPLPNSNTTVCCQQDTDMS